MPNAKNLTTISITRSNYAILKNLGKTGESFNDVITKLLESKMSKNVSRGLTDQQVKQVSQHKAEQVFYYDK
jgi:predicted CopG family antitoxin